MEITAQWLAGFVDGEGCLTIHTSMRGRKSRSRTQGRLSIANTHLPTLMAIQSKWGGKLQSKKYRNSYTAKQAYELMWYNQEDLVRVITAIHPYVVVKRDQFDLFVSHYLPTVIYASRTYHLSSEDYEKRRMVKVALEELKQKNYPLPDGIVPGSLVQ
jgi:LAGLIDADG endonuclease